MAPLASATAQHNAACNEQNAKQQRDGISESREERRGIGGRGEHGIDCTGLAQRDLFDDVAATGRPSSTARSLACARCWGGPQEPNQASFDGLKMNSGRFRASTTWPEKMIS